MFLNEGFSRDPNFTLHMTGPLNCTYDLEREVRYCSNCGKTENEIAAKDKAAVLQLCGDCRSVRYCSAKCQLTDWPVHRKICKKGYQSPKQTKKTDKLSFLLARFLRTKTSPMPVHAIQAIFRDWTEIYRALLTFIFINASVSAPNHAPQVLYVKLSMPSTSNLEIKARCAFQVEDAEFLTLEEFRRATVNKSHRLYSEENGQILDGYNRHVQIRMPHGSIRRLNMVVQRLEVQHEGVPLTYFKSWFHEDASDYATQSKFRDGTWLKYLKEKVADGEGWHYSRFD
ncbi:hypothetical protein E4T56_gene9305 [Termitomyces sp. T112]|nr:hypothetical protein E4T56_gene9305 [Termitomyces sp. T112]